MLACLPTLQSLLLGMHPESSVAQLPTRGSNLKFSGGLSIAAAAMIGYLLSLGRKNGVRQP
jgi:hypothetical protein